MSTQRKIFVLDTNVLIHDPLALSSFAEHDVIIPIVVLEEMDHIKRGFDELARNVREVSRQLDAISGGDFVLAEGSPLPGGGRLYFELNSHASKILPEPLAVDSPDNRIIAVTMAKQRQFPDRAVILVSKDINMRIKARALGLTSEDYRSDRVVDDLNILPSGVHELSDQLWAQMAVDMETHHGLFGNDHTVVWPDEEPLPVPNGFVRIGSGQDFVMQCRKIDDGRRVLLCSIKSFRSERHSIWGITARNAEQNMAMNLLMDQELDLVCILGQAGTGKTLLTLACALYQTLERNLFEKILVTRATVPMGQDIGFLPGGEGEKLEPWMGAIKDNLTMLLGRDFTGFASAKSQYKIEVTAMSFTRGRTFTNTWLIVDEAQNLTPHQMKTLVTRMGQGSRIIILGNNGQIDTPYLTAHSNGLSLAVMRFSGWEHAGQITLRASERSRLAAYAGDVM